MFIDQDKIKLIELLYASNILKFGKFKLSSGKNSPYYLNLRIIQRHPDVFQVVVKSYLDMIYKIGLDSFDVICGVSSAGLVFSSPLSFLTHKSHVYVRKHEKTYGLKNSLEGDFTPNSNVLIIDDIFTTGNSIKKTLDVINKNSGIIDNVLVLINRMENTDDFLIQNDIKLNYVFSIIDFANILYDKSLITSTQKEILLSQF